ncbi:MAG: hypothetical protein QXR45_12670 [Candidatus Bathyarchaeia archaeon]
MKLSRQRADNVNKHLPAPLKTLRGYGMLCDGPKLPSRRNRILVAEKGGKPYIKLKMNSLMKAKG